MHYENIGLTWFPRHGGQHTRDLRQPGPIKVKQGLTSLEEVMAVTNE